MILYVESLKHTHRNLLELINEFCEVAGYKNDMQIPISFLYSSIVQLKMKLTVLFTVTPKRIQYLSTVFLKKKCKTCMLKTCMLK